MYAKTLSGVITVRFFNIFLPSAATLEASCLAGKGARRPGREHCLSSRWSRFDNDQISVMADIADENRAYGDEE
ncbi:MULTISPECIES: hypothetical protein [unclassified Sinorhizobium]|uniref:hypothetical protein n=1 Tax=unclassified Sinorhizobium TaxID=2613772 RepID=UPI0024C3AE23|nr:MULTISPECIES: hypothetical protein [unclassified Sinorhizobium]MDK1373720.1 hypothetical protein [Sinorhizobium sp. 6-70]MDK1478779.1 hypothetical protein [Sinorhizobium sp. 6-117]